MVATARRDPRRAVRALILLLVVAVVAALVVAFRSGRDAGPDVDPSAAPSASGPPAGVSDPAEDPALSRFYGQRLAWRGCSGGLQCTSLTVPVDWSAPEGDTLQVAVAKFPAEERAIGALVVNPGGPGASGIAYAQAAPQAFGAAVLRNYDVVGFDPRGVGQSEPVKCLPNAQIEAYFSAEATPDTPAELATALRDQRAFGQACERNTGEVIRHVDTLSVVRDMDVLRQALGQSNLTYQGASYGTYIGAWYAETFPWRVGRMVLDGAVDPSLTSAQYIAGQAEGFSRALRAYVADCQEDRNCPLRGSVENGLDQVGLLVDAADGAPLRTDSGRRLTQALMTTGIAQGLYAQQLWPALTTGLADALKGDGTGLLRLADLYLERDENGVYGQTFAANPAIFCLDSDETRTPEQIRADAQALGRQFPPLGETIGWGGLGCAQWPVPAVVPRKELHATGAAPILVLGTVDDPATPYEWAQGLASQLSSARLVTWDGSVHTAYRQGSDCVDDAVEAYLLAGDLPAEGLRCR